MKKQFHLFFTAAIIATGVTAFAQNAIGFGSPTTKNQERITKNSLKGSGMCFTPNKGQIADSKGNLRPEILYKGAGGGADVYLRKTGISYVTSNMGEVMHEINTELENLKIAGVLTDADEQQKQDELMQKAILKVHRVDMDFAECNSTINIINEDEVEGKLNFYYAHCPEGVTSVSQFNKVTYKNIYNNIDVAMYGNREKGLKYDIIVNPHADPNQIKLQWTGAESIHINNKGHLVIKTSVNEFYESMPKVYQIINGKVIDVKANYILDGATVNFELGTWNHEQALIIDPATWITYYGGIGMEYCGSVAVDLNGNPVFTGYTKAANFPVTTGAFQTAINSTTDAFVVKFDPSGVPVFSTYFGGSNTESIQGVATDLNGNIYSAGFTYSTDLPTKVWGTAFMQAAYSGGTGDAFVLKLSPAGALLWSTYYGGSAWDIGKDIVTDGLNNIYFTGTTLSTNFPTMAPFQSVMNGTGAPGRDPFVVKFNSSGVRQWATYYGGSADDEADGIATDISNNVYMCGLTHSPNFPTLSAFQNVFGGDTDAFLCRLDPATGFPVWSTYYGGTGTSHIEGGYAVATDALGNVFLGMLTDSPNTGNAIATPGAYKTALNGIIDGAVIKFTNTGIRVWGTYLGGSSGMSYVSGLAVDPNNNIIAGGDTYAKDFGTTGCAYQKIFAGTEDQFIVTLDQLGSLLCSGLIGIGDQNSPNNETQWSGGSIAVSGCFVYMNAMSSCTYPVTANGFQTLCAGGSANDMWDAAFSKLYINTCGGTVSSMDFNSPASICAGQTVYYTSSYTGCDNTSKTYSWSLPGGTPGTSTQQNPSVVYSGSGTYNVKLVVSAPCGKDSVMKTIMVNPCTITAAATPGTICSPNTCINITAAGSAGTGPYTYSWNTGAVNASINVCPLASTTYTVKVTDALGNYAYSTASVTVNSAIPPLNPSSTNISCTSSGSAAVNPTAGASYPYTYNWSTGESGSKTISCPTAGGYTLTVTDVNGCTVTQTFTITGSSPVSATFTTSQACVGSVTNFINTGTSPGTGVSYSWTIAPVNGLNITSGTTADFSYIFLSPGTYSVNHTVMSGGCNATITQNITVTNCNGPTVTAAGSSVCSGNCATVTSSATGGTQPYTYSWNTGATTQNINPCPVTSTIYTVTVTDGGGNTATSTTVVTVNPTVTVTATSTNITCSGTSTGSVAATPGGGTPAFNYVWNNGITTATGTNLAAGNYTVTVTDSKGCTAVSTTTITAPPALIGQYTKGTANCSNCGCKEWIMVTGINGTPPYIYQWPDGYDKRYKNALCPGAYNVIVTDNNGCKTTVKVNAP